LEKKIKLIIVGLIAGIIFETIIIFGIQDFTKFNLDYEFTTNVILISIPIFSAIITTKWISNSWQKRKETNEIKKQILTEFTQSFAREYSMIGEFVGRLYNNYLDPLNSKMNPDGTFSFVTKFPINDDEKPFKKYQSQWKEFDKDFWKLTYPKNEFFTIFRLYINDKKLHSEIGKAEEQLNDIYSQTILLLYSKNLTEFQERFDSITKELDDVLQKTISIETKLINSTIEVK